MLTYIEDVFIQFYELISLNDLSDKLTQQDFSASYSFSGLLYSGGHLTINQSNYVLKILQKYKSFSLEQGLDYSEALKNPVWKQPFRVLDMSKKVWAEKTDQGEPIVCLKFPYQLKSEFENSVDPFHDSRWDNDRKVRTLPVYDTNLLVIYDFAECQNFEIDDSFLEVVSEVEEIWQNEEKIVPGCIIEHDQVMLLNSSNETEEWFINRSTGNINNDLLLAKSMGYPYLGKPFTTYEKIASENNNAFWIKNNQEFLELTKNIDGIICIVLDRAHDPIAWLKEFVKDIDQCEIERSSVKVCFRQPKTENPEFNDWVKENGLGGSMINGKIYIFNYKPAKWLFKEEKNVTILATNNLSPSTNTLTNDWLNTHPCVMYLGDIKPSELRNQKIVKL